MDLYFLDARALVKYYILGNRSVGHPFFTAEDAEDAEDAEMNAFQVWG